MDIGSHLDKICLLVETQLLNSFAGSYLGRRFQGESEKMRKERRLSPGKSPVESGSLRGSKYVLSCCFEGAYFSM